MRVQNFLLFLLLLIQSCPAFALPLEGRILIRINYDGGTKVFELSGMAISESSAQFPKLDGYGAGSKSTPELPSPDNLFVAYGFNPNGETPWVYFNYAIRNVQTKQEIANRSIKPRFLQDLAWSPDSQHLAIIEEKERWGKNPFALLAMFAGHPIPHAKFFLTVLDLKGVPVLRTQIPGSWKYATARVVWTP